MTAKTIKQPQQLLSKRKVGVGAKPQRKRSKSSGIDRQAVSSNNRYLVTIVTSRKYTRDTFIAEAKRLGVSRAIGIRTLMRLQDGEPIFVADFESSDNKRAEVYTETLPDGTVVVSRGKSKTGTLIVFGFFRAESVALQITKQAMKELEQAGLITKTDKEPFGERRHCGSTTFSETYDMNAPISELAAKVHELVKQGHIVKKAFIRGPFMRIDPPIIIENVKYYRGYKYFPAPPLMRIPLKQTKGQALKIDYYKYHKNKETSVTTFLKL